MKSWKSFEREWPKKSLSRWWTNGQYTGIFKRIPGQSHQGDVTVNLNHPHYKLGLPLIDHFNIELKAPKEFDILKLLDHNKNVRFLEYAAQCERDARETNRIPILVIKRDNRKPYIGMKFEFIELSQRLSNILWDKPFILLDTNWWLCSSVDFFATFKPEHFKLLGQNTLMLQE